MSRAMKRSRLFLLPTAAAGLAGALYLSGVLSAQSLATPNFTTAQAAQGAAAYQRSCASCHGTNLDDGEFAPPLKGVEFRLRFGGKPLDALHEDVLRMPPTAPNSLGDAVRAQILAYLAQENGVTSTNRELSIDATVLRGAAIPGAAGGPSGGLTTGVPIPPPPARLNPLDRITTVTDRMLTTPADGDWLTWRRSADNMGFSPLMQIDRQTVTDLRLAWSWALPNGPNEVPPLVHDGVMFVHGFGDKVQAIDAATGDLLWQYSRRLPRDRAPTVKRGLALYADNLYVPTSDAHMVALNVKSGDVVWDHTVADAGAGFGITGGVLAANFIVALNAQTGAEAWRFNTIARPGEPGGSSWNGLPVNLRNG